jgi:phosphonate transport system substrate-binding protein
MEYHQETLNKALTISTCMASNMDDHCRDLAHYLSLRLSLPVELIIDVPWQERERLLDEGKLDLCWICGLPYIRKVAQAPGSMDPLVAPVMSGSRYQNRPIYFSDVVVHRDSPYLSLDDLQGAAWAYNEPGSHSGYGVVRYALALRGKTLNLFGRVIESGAHQTSLAMILKKEIDGSAIDSTVLELELVHHPEIASRLRIIDTFGPSPIPPWVVSRKTSPEMRTALLDALTHLDMDPKGKAILQKAGIARFAPVVDRDYDPIREMARIAFSYS